MRSTDPVTSLIVLRVMPARIEQAMVLEAIIENYIVNVKMNYDTASQIRDNVTNVWKKIHITNLVFFTVKSAHQIQSLLLVEASDIRVVNVILLEDIKIHKINSTDVITNSQLNSGIRCKL